MTLSNTVRSASSALMATIVVTTVSIGGRFGLRGHVWCQLQLFDRNMNGARRTNHAFFDGKKDNDQDGRPRSPIAFVPFDFLLIDGACRK
jgi:hypothetical protein